MTSLTACSGPQSALDPAGPAARELSTLFWVMAYGSGLLTLLLAALALFATYGSPRLDATRALRILVIGCGVAFPSLVLTGLLIYGLWSLPRLLAAAPEGSLRVHVVAERWWWRVQYELADGTKVEAANEIRMPLGQPVQFELSSADVIHSFWIPSLGGKVDMIPGRHTRLALRADRAGELRGVCAEYCGESHAHMAFPVLVMERGAFGRWLAHEASHATAPRTASSIRGERVFTESGCGACHVVRGTQSDGVIGPDLTHVGSRLSLGAGTLENDHQGRVRFVAHTGRVKPGVLMPAFGALAEEDQQAVARYLEALR